MYLYITLQSTLFQSSFMENIAVLTTGNHLAAVF